VLSDVLGRAVSLVDALAGRSQVSNGSSVKLMEHAATLDLEDFETPSSRTSSSGRGGRRAAGSPCWGSCSARRRIS
jgi:hypothetical protein